MMPRPVQSCSCSHRTHLSGLSFCVSSCAFYISKNDVLFCLLTPFFFLSPGTVSNYCAVVTLLTMLVCSSNKTRC